MEEDIPENKTEKFYLPVTLCDGKNPETTQNVTVDILGINRPPRILGCTQYKPTAKENANVGTSVITVSTDLDS